MTFSLDPRLMGGSHPITMLRLCEARLQDDARFAWIVLTPARSGLVELAELTPREQVRLRAEVGAAGAAVRAVGDALGRPVVKLNHGQLGNVVAQLHIHVVGRRPDDSAWPAAVWGCGAVEPFEPEALATALEAARRTLASASKTYLAIRREG